MKSISIDVFSDVVCPWCFVGTHRLQSVLDSLDASQLEVSVRFHTFMLDPNAPEVGLDIPTMLARKYGGDPKRMFATVESAARESNLELDLTKQSRFYPTARAHTLLRHAVEKGTQRALVNALFQAYFIEAMNIADPDVLASIASRHGFAVDEAIALVRDEQEIALTHQEAQDASQSGIRGVPFFVFNEAFALSGAQPEDVFRAAIDKALSDD